MRSVFSIARCAPSSFERAGPGSHPDDPVLVFQTMPWGAACRRASVTAILPVAWAVGCGSEDSPRASEGASTATTSSAIQGGTTDTTHTFAVAVAQMSTQGVALCSGVLLAPNLVATARHCVSLLSSPQIDCATSTFGGTLPAKDLFVTSSATIDGNTSFIPVVGGSSGDDGVIVPSGTNVCGNDIALLILSQPIQVPQYVTPAINPPMSDQRVYSTAVTAIGYGVDTPTDTNGASAGTRRIKQDINLICIPNDPTFTDCLSDPTWLQIATANEFEGGDGTCEGDSGSGAFDQGNFAKGNWVAFGVLSRGGVNAEGGTCIGSIYTRFDAYSQLLISAAAKAAKMGGYSPPSWTGLSAAADASTVSPEAGTAPVCLPNAAMCGQDSDCCSVNCISHNNNQTAFCTACDANNPCASGFSCAQGVCVSAPGSGSDSGSGGLRSHGAGCSVGSPLASPDRALPPVLACLGLIAGAKRRKRRPVEIQTASRAGDVTARSCID